MTNLDLDKELNTDEIFQAVEEAYQNNRNRIIKFFHVRGFDDKESADLTHSMRHAVYFLETHCFDRHDIEIVLRKNMRDLLKKKQRSIKNLLNEKEMLKDIVPEIDWGQNLEIRYAVLEENPAMKMRASKNLSLKLSLEPLFWKLKRMGHGQSKQVNIVYDLFVEFELDDYANEPYHTKDQYIGDKEKKERIRKQFQQPAIKSRDEYVKLFGWDE